MGRARSRWDHQIFRKQLSTQDWTFYFYQRLARKTPKNGLIFGSNQNGLKLKPLPPPPPSLRKVSNPQNHQVWNAGSTTTTTTSQNGLLFRCLGHDFGWCLFSLFGFKGAWWSFCSHVCLRSSRGIVGRVVDLGRRRQRFLWGLIDFSGWNPEPGTFGLIPAEPLQPPGVPADLVDDAGWNVLFYAVKEAFSQLTAFLLGTLMLWDWNLPMFFFIDQCPRNGGHRGGVLEIILKREV